MSIAQRIHELQASIPGNVTLVAVSKFHPVEALEEAYQAGQRAFGESRAQELMAKAKVLPKDIEWHFIGPLQSNKVKEILSIAWTRLSFYKKSKSKLKKTGGSSGYCSKFMWQRKRPNTVSASKSASPL